MKRALRASAALASAALVSSFALHAAAQQQGDPPPLPPSGQPAEPAGQPVPPAEPAATTPAAVVAPTPSPEDKPVETRGLKPLQLDVRATFNTDIVLAYVGVGVSGDVGLVPIGPGTLAVGGAFEYAACGSVCWLFSALTPLEFSHRQVWPQGRASYHIGLASAKKLDLYPFVAVGPVFARSEIAVDNGAARYVGTDTSIGVTFGGGLNLFVAGPLFIGGEARIRYAAGDYSYKLESGDGTRTYDKGSVETWSLTGIDVLLAIGVRIP